MFSLFKMLISESVYRIRCAISHVNLIREKSLYLTCDFIYGFGK